MKTYNPVPALITPVEEFPGEVKLDLLREDLIGGDIQGNKFRKLYYNLNAAKANNSETLISFGGAYSNHIAALAAAAKHFDFKAIGC